MDDVLLRCAGCAIYAEKSQSSTPATSAALAYAWIASNRIRAFARVASEAGRWDNLIFNPLGSNYTPKPKMFSRKDDELFDLEAVIPKEHKEEAVSDSHEIADAEVSRASTGVTEVCHSCGRTSDDIQLMPVFHRGADRWVCPKCLKSSIDSDAQADYLGSSSGIYGESSETESESEAGSTDDYHSPMSMFD